LRRRPRSGYDAPTKASGGAGGGMSDTDSFINEVTEEVRRDRLYGMFRRWGWFALRR